MTNIRVGGVLIADVGELSAFDFSTSYGSGFGGHDQASWTFKPRGTFSANNFDPRAAVNIYHGGAHCFEGEFSELAFADNGDVTMSARGHGYRLSDLDSILWSPRVGTDIYYPTGNLVEGWDFAETELGLNLNIVTVLPTGAPSMGDVSEQPVKLSEVITAHTQYEGNKWTVWGKDLAFVADDVSSPLEFAAPVSSIAVADTDYYTHVYVWYVWDGPDAWSAGTTYAPGDVVLYDSRKWVAGSPVVGTPPTDGAWTEKPYTSTPNEWSFGRAIDTAGLALFDARTVVVDYRGLGKMSSSEADAIALGLLEQVKGRFVFTGAVTVTPASGFPVPLQTLRAGTALRLKHTRTSMGAFMPYGSNVFIIGRTEYSWTPDSESCTLTPMGAVARNLPDILRGVPRDGGSAIAGAA